MNELAIPPAAQRDPKSFELMRAWVAEKGLHCSLKIGVYDEQDIREETAWGTILADAARHIADALASSAGRDREEALREIRDNFEIELDNPTSEVRGDFVS
jgi:hypothetical protein